MFATPDDALAHTTLAAIRAGRRADGVLNQVSPGGDVPMVLAPATGSYRLERIATRTK
jgi:hypothetical protein